MTDRNTIPDAIRYWEARRILYNAALAALATGWVVRTWPHFRPAFTPQSLVRVLILAGLANLCYCAAYMVDVPLGLSSSGSTGRRWRFPLWLFGTLFALVFAQYWIGDEIYPFVDAAPD